MRLLAVLLLALPLTGPAGPAVDAAVARYRLANEALAQAERPGADWDPAQRDCAGFVRLLYRKALGARGPLWSRRDGSRVPFVKADELIAYNFVPIARTPSRELVETGDLLAFHDAEKPPSDAWHLMVLLQPPPTAPQRLLAVYHTGESGSAGVVKKVWLDDLLAGPEEWRPVAGNPAFLGTFRWAGWSRAADDGRPR